MPESGAATSPFPATGLSSGRLPAPVSSFVGRDWEIEAVTSLMHSDGVRLVTLTGPGGVGKTRLALEVAQGLVAAFADGIVLVDLAAVTTPALVPQAIARAVGVRAAGDAPVAARVTRWVRAWDGLLLLDNCEHLLDAVPFVAELLAAGPELRVLATSRERLRIAGEHEIPVSPLDLPLLNDREAETVRGTGAVRLFVARARAVSPGFALTEENASAVAAMCHRLDGLPLAIELAAARVKALPPMVLLARMDRRLPLLTGGGRDAPARQRTMRDAIAWSHDLLTPEEQRLFRRLSVFAGGATLEAVAGVAGVDVLEGLTSLVDKSLLRSVLGPGNEPRFAMLETVREYGQERLAEAGEDAAVRLDHAWHYLELARRAAAEIHGPGMRRWCDALEAEHPNLLVALDTLVVSKKSNAELDLSTALGAFWFHRGHLREGITHLLGAVARGADAPSSLRVEALAWVGHLALSLGDRAALQDAAADALALAQEAGDDVATAHALYVRALEAGWFGGDWGRGVALAEQAVALVRATERPIWFRGHVVGDLGAMLVMAGERERGVALIEEAVAVHRQAGQHWGAGLKLAELGLAAQQSGNAQRAAAYYGEGLRLIWDVGDAAHVHHAVTGLAGLAADHGQFKTAVRLLGAVAVIEERSGAAIHPPWRPIRARGEARAQSNLGSAEYGAALAAGQALPTERAVEEALALADALASPPAPRVAPFGLSRRETDVLRLLSQRLTDKEIANALSVSPRTASFHVASVLRKLGVNSRRDAAAVVTERGIE